MKKFAALSKYMPPADVRRGTRLAQSIDSRLGKVAANGTRGLAAPGVDRRLSKPFTVS
jgi:hypothetical protein